MKSYFKYFFNTPEHWILICVILIVWGIALIDAGLPMLVWALPIALLFYRSYLMYKKK